MTQAEREHAYSPSSCVPDGNYVPFIEEGRSAGQSSWSQVQASSTVQASTISYGSMKAQTIDLAVPAADDPVPLLIYLHGGYWQELSKADAHFAASDCARQGWAYGAVGYTLAPDADLAAIVAECRSAVRMLRDQAGSLGIDPTRIFVAGSSAGAHLAAMVALDPSLPAGAVRGVILLSGIFELEPLVETSINDALGLDEPTARALSPLLAELDGFPAALLFYGEHETDEFKAQSHDFADKLGAAQTSVSVTEVPDRNHFDVVLDLARPTTTIGDAVVAFIESSGGTDANL